MKKLFSLLLLLAACATAATAQGIQFHEGDWNSALAKAKSENKAIFVDAYTTWCGPCKMMAKNTFTDAEVGDFFNKNFICVKMDMEKGEGLTMAAEQQVRAYPTYLFFASDGSSLHRSLGYMKPAEFIQAGQDALDPNKQLASLTNRYNKGDRDADFLLKYAYACRNSMNGQHEKVAMEYLAAQPKWEGKETMQFILEMIGTAGTKPFDYVSNNREIFVAEFGEEQVDDFLARGISQSLFNDAANADEPLSDKADLLFKKYFAEKGALYSARFMMDFYAGQENWEEYAKVSETYINRNKEINAQELNSIAWAFYLAIDNKDQLKKAVEWAKRSVAMEAGYYNMDTLAALYFKTGNKKNAKKYAKMAIEQAKKEGQDPKETEELLEKINQM